MTFLIIITTVHNVCVMYRYMYSVTLFLFFCELGLTWFIGCSCPGALSFILIDIIEHACFSCESLALRDEEQVGSIALTPQAMIKI